jgi:hypothetical protein
MATTDDLLEATYSDIRIIKGRKVLVISVEVPLENFDKAMQVLGGAPMPDRETWVFLGRLDRAVARPPAAPEPVIEPSPAPRPKKAWPELPATQRAALLCDDHRFRAWLAAKGRIAQPTEDDTVAYLRRICGGSRGNLGKDGFETETEAFEAVDRAFSKHLEHQRLDSMR